MAVGKRRFRGQSGIPLDKLELKVSKVHKPAEPEPRRTYLEITNYKSQITNKLQISMTKITNSYDGLLRTF